MGRIGYLVHDVLCHPLCGLCWMCGAGRLGDWLHDVTVFDVNRKAEIWDG